MSAFDVSIRTNLKDIERKLTNLARQQLPFATATALTGLAKRVQKDEQAAMRRVFDRPTPFTVNAVGTKAARKSNQTATVFVRDIAASYLEPFEFGGTHKMLGSGRTWFNPKNGLPLNQYGNLSRSKLAQLKARSDVFVGKIRTKHGEVIDGVWQRPYFRLGTAQARGKSFRGNSGLARGANTTGHLKLLIRFGDPMPVHQKLNYRARAKAVVDAQFDAAFGAALAQALASALP